MKRLFAALLPACFVAYSVTAQDLMMVEYPIAFPQGNTQDYIEKTCWRNLSIGYRHIPDGNVAIGIDMSGHTFFEHKDYATYTRETVSISGEQYRYMNTFTASVQADYVLNEGEDFRPFLGIGAGTLYANRSTDFGVYRFITDSWQFMIQPEIGISYYLSNGTGLLISANYYAGFDTQDLEGQTFLTLNIGLVFRTD